MDKKKEKKVVKKDNKKIIIAIVAIVIIAIVLFLLLGNKKEDKKDNNKEQGNNNVVDYATRYWGIFTNGTSEIYLYPISVNKVFYTIDGNGYYEGVVTATDKTAENDDFTFNVSGENIEMIIKAKGTSLTGGVYDKVGDYTDEDFYEYNIGPLEYFDSEYTARFKNDNAEMILIQISETEVEVEIHKGSTMNYNGISGKYIIQEDKSLIKENYSEEDGNKIAIDKNKAIFVAKEENDKEYEGTYEKDDNLEIKDIISFRYSNYY